MSRSSRFRLLAGLLFASLLPSATHAQLLQGYKVVHTYPHDSGAFTQGLVFEDGHLYESDGLYGKSTLREDDLTTGHTLSEHNVPPMFFAEGLTDWGNTLIQLTWKEHTAFVYDRSTFKLLRTVNYPYEGWGLTQDGHSLILSDGSATLHFLDPNTFKEVRSVQVTDHGKPVDQLNELEYIHGQVFANIWFTDKIARISPTTGHVLAYIDLAGILPAIERQDENAVLNGIAYDAAHDRLFVTGKQWPELFEIKVMDKH